MELTKFNDKLEWEIIKKNVSTVIPSHSKSTSANLHCYQESSKYIQGYRQIAYGLILSSLQTNIDTFANNVGPDKTACN